MSKRLQVLYRQMQRVARRQGLSLAEWVRQVLRDAFRQVPSGNREKKLLAVRRAAECEFPVGDIEEMLDEIARGYSESG